MRPSHPLLPLHKFSKKACATAAADMLHFPSLHPILHTLASPVHFHFLYFLFALFYVLYFHSTHLMQSILSLRTLLFSLLWCVGVNLFFSCSFLLHSTLPLLPFSPTLYILYFCPFMCHMCLHFTANSNDKEGWLRVDFIDCQRSTSDGHSVSPPPSSTRKCIGASISSAANNCPEDFNILSLHLSHVEYSTSFSLSVVCFLPQSLSSLLFRKFKSNENCSIPVVLTSLQ